MSEQGFAVFDTAIGACGIAWGAKGIVGVQLPAADAQATRARMRRKFGDADEVTPPAVVQDVIVNIVALLRGEPADFSSAELDMDGVPDFHRRVYDVARSISRGHTMTYGEITTILDAPRAAQTVGYALGRNPFPIIVPCHRVVAAGGKTGGFSAPGGVEQKLRILAIEGARVGSEVRNPKSEASPREQLELGVLDPPSR